MEFLRAIGPVFNFLLLALALIFFTRKQIRKLFQERRDRIADALGRAADAQDQARHTAEDIAEAQQAADAEAHAQLHRRCGGCAGPDVRSRKGLSVFQHPAGGNGKDHAGEGHRGRTKAQWMRREENVPCCSD